MAAVKDKLMKLEEAYSFFRDPEIGMAIDTIKVMEDRIEALEKALLEIHEYPMAFEARQILLKALGEKKDD